MRPRQLSGAPCGLVFLLAIPCVLSFVLTPSCGRGRSIGIYRFGDQQRPPHLCCAAFQCDSDPPPGSDHDGTGYGVSLATRRVALLRAAGAAAAGVVGLETIQGASANQGIPSKRSYFQRFPTLFSPLYGDASRETTRHQLNDNMWALEQNLELGPLQTPFRCVVIKLKDDTLWVHAPLTPTEEFFELVESCSDGPVAHVVIPTYALEHKVFAKDALTRWPHARLWTAPGQFSFPLPSVPDEYIWGRSVSGVLTDSDQALSSAQIPWVDEIQ